MFKRLQTPFKIVRLRKVIAFLTEILSSFVYLRGESMQKLYVVRDADGAICSLSAEPEVGAQAASFDDPEVQAFLHRLDIDLVRVIEDVVDLLVSRGVFRFTDLPESAREKLLFRKSLRSQWQSVPDPLGSEEGLF